MVDAFFVDDLLAGKKSLNIQFVGAAYQGLDTHPLDWFGYNDKPET